VKVIFDASSLINLLNGQALLVILNLKGFSFWVGPQVLQECGNDALDPMITSGSIGVVDDSNVSANVFLELLEAYELGPGETECLALASVDNNYVICTDDGAARSVTSSLFGGSRLIGSLFLVRECVRQSLINEGSAKTIHQTMIEAGGFLPTLPGDYFLT